MVYASDHGEMAGEHGTWWKSAWYEACTRVPLMVSLPAHRRGELAPSRMTTPVSLLDLAPTFSGFAGAAPITGASGIDLGAAIQGGTEPPPRPIVIDHLNPRWGSGSEFRAVRLGPYKLIRFARFAPLLFDLAGDPGEQQNIFQSASGEALAVRDRLLALVAETMDFDALDQRRTASQQRLKATYPLDSSGYLPNQYQLASGRVIEADATLYRPDVITDQPGTFFADWPGRPG